VVAMTRLALVFFCLWDRRDGCFSTPRAEYTTFWKFFVKIFLTLANKKRRGVLQIGNKCRVKALTNLPQAAWILMWSFGVALGLRE
jgi:hypothetical protein